MKLCKICLKRLSLGRTVWGWLGCIVCQREVDAGIRQFVIDKFGVDKFAQIRSTFTEAIK